jgi:N-acetylglucosaminyldiphosphoundecaprenol N-acetyl-beta-D-mannosaminyltransferase
MGAALNSSRRPPGTWSPSDLSPDQAKPGVRILASRIAPLNLDGTVELLGEMVSRKSRGYICVANVYTTMLAVREPRFREVLNDATAVVADGMPVVWRVQSAGYPQAGRVYGANLMAAVCAAGIRGKIRHGFLGGHEETGNAIVSRLTQRFPELEVAGVWNPGIVQPGEPATPQLLEAINKSRCDILWVGLGAPKQEIWMAQHRSCLDAPVLVGVGQAFDIVAGRTAPPPAWIGRHGLEWIYRLFHEPRRLWRRYLLYNSLFVWYLLLERVGFGWRPETTVWFPSKKSSNGK